MEEVLLSLHRSLAHKTQKEAWQDGMRAFAERKADHEDELRRVRGEAYQVATLCTVFQGVIFTAVSQANLLTCQLWWSPVSLSVAVSVATFFAIAEKLYSMGEIKEDIKEMGLNMSALQEYLDEVERQGAALDLETAQPRQEYLRDKLAGYRFIGSKDGISALFVLAAFSFLIARFSANSLCLHCPPCAS